MANHISSQIKFILEEQKKYEELLTEIDAQTTRKRYEENIQNFLEDAKRRHVRMKILKYL